MIAMIGLIALLVGFAQAGNGLALPQNIVTMSDADLTTYRDCLRLAIQDGRYSQVAGQHGVPMGFCPHGNLRFLPWHRYHLAAMETALNCSIPYWDWASGPVPACFMDETYMDANGRQWPNPLRVGVKPGSLPTTRAIAAQFPTAQLADSEALALSRADVAAFSKVIEDAHNLVHISLGGDMSTIDYASYDVIFYSHHKNVDRLWFRWQVKEARNQSAYAAIANDTVTTDRGSIPSMNIANDLSGWLPTRSSSTPTATNTTTPTTADAVLNETALSTPNAIGSLLGGATSTLPGSGASTMPEDVASTLPGGATSTLPGGAASTLPGGSVSTLPGGAASMLPSGTASTLLGGAASALSPRPIASMPGSADAMLLPNAVAGLPGSAASDLLPETAVSPNALASLPESAASMQGGMIPTPGSAASMQGGMVPTPGSAASTLSPAAIASLQGIVASAKPGSSASLNAIALLQGSAASPNVVGSMPGSAASKQGSAASLVGSRPGVVAGLNGINDVAMGASLAPWSGAEPIVIGDRTQTSSSMLGNGSMLVTTTTLATSMTTTTMVVNALPMFRTRTEMEASAAHQHIILTIPDLKSTIMACRLDVLIDQICVGAVGLFGMGMKGMAYKLDRQLDLTYAYTQLTANHTRDLESFRSRITYKLFNEQNELIAAPKLKSFLTYNLF